MKPHLRILEPITIFSLFLLQTLFMLCMLPGLAHFQALLTCNLLKIIVMDTIHNTVKARQKFSAPKTNEQHVRSSKLENWVEQFLHLL